MPVKDRKYRMILGARNLRREMTPTEKLLWKYLSDRGMVGAEFSRQHPVNGFIIDFYCASHRLGIEIDGPRHDDNAEADQERQTILESTGIRIIRFKNEEVTNSLDSVLKRIKRTLFPSPRSGEGCPDEVGAG